MSVLSDGTKDFDYPSAATRTVEERLLDIELTVDRIEKGVNIILSAMDRTEQMVGKIIEEVKPTIDELMNSQLFKMLGMKKKG